MAPVAIAHPVQLLVEGKDPVNFFGALTRHLELGGIQVQNYGGINELGGFLKAFVMAPGFADVTNLGVVRDAEGSPSAWRRGSATGASTTTPSSASAASSATWRPIGLRGNACLRRGRVVPTTP